MLFFALGLEIIDGDTENSFNIDSRVVPKCPVLYGYKCVHRILRYLIIGQIAGILIAGQLSKNLAVRVIDEAGLLHRNVSGVLASTIPFHLCLILEIHRIDLISPYSQNCHQRNDTYDKKCHECNFQHLEHRSEYNLDVFPQTF